MKMKPLSVGILLVACAAATACITTHRYEAYPGNPPVTQAPPPMIEPEPPMAGSDQPFYDDLAPYGRWIHVEGPGWAWSPAGVRAGWRPYHHGHWVFTDHGWTWASDEPYGWAVYHYGRWHHAPGHGWVWVPGTEWGPAWVAWHEGGDYVGWAPLPWQVTVRAGVGLDWNGVNVSIAPASWCFVTTRYLVDPGLRHRIEPPARNVTLIKVTRNITNYTYIDNRVVNRGVRVEKVSKAAGRKVHRYRIADARSADMVHRGKSRGDEFPVYRPDPRRGHKSHGGNDRPGHYEREGPRDHRAAPAAQATPDHAMPDQAAPDQATPAPAPVDQPRGRSSKQVRDNSQYERKPGRQPSPDAPAPATAPAQGAPSRQQAGPVNPAASRSSEKARTAKARGKGGKKKTPKAEESKPEEESKPRKSDAGTAKPENPDSGH